MRAARSVSACLLIALLWPGSSLAQDIDVLIYSDQPGGGSLLAADYDFSEPNAIFLSFCFGGSCLYTTTDPGFRTPDEDRPGESLYAVSAGTDVFLEIVAIDPAVSLQVAGVVIDTPGEAAELGTAQGVHIHPLLQAVVDEGETGVYPVSFKLTGAGYSESATYELLLSNEPAPTPSPSPSPTPTSSPTPSPSPTPMRLMNSSRTGSQPAGMTVMPRSPSCCALINAATRWACTSTPGISASFCSELNREKGV